MKAPLTARAPRGAASSPRERPAWSESEQEAKFPSRKPLGKAQSASPRPQRFRAVDAVKLAKHELECQTGPVVKAGRLRISQFSAFDQSSAGELGPVIHEGFYKLTAAVTRPTPSLRQKAAALQQSFESRLRLLRLDQRAGAKADDQEACGPEAGDAAERAPLLALEGAGSGYPGQSDTFITAQEEPHTAVASDLQLVSVPAQAAEPGEPAEPPAGQVDAHKVSAEVELAKQELALCVDTLQSYARETSSESRERRELLDAASSTASASLEKLVHIIERQSREAEAAARRHAELEAKVAELVGDADGLRTLVQRGMREEAELKQEMEEKIAEVQEGQQSLVEAERRADKLTAQLEEARERIRRRDDELRQAQENLRDGANSPMMAFSAFVLGPDQVPAGGPTSLSQCIGGDVLKEKTDTKRLERHQTTTSFNSSSRASMLLTANSGLHVPPSSRQSGRLETVNSSPCSRSGSPDQGHPGSSNQSDGQDSSGTPTQMVTKKRTSRSRRRSEEDDSSDSDREADVPRASPLASSFPALVPYLDFQKADVEADKIKALTAAQNQEHLEKHMVMLQEERQQHMERNQLLQQAVDATMERILVWVQASYDSLHDFGPPSVQQDAEALAAIRDMLAWLAQCSCKAWVDPPENLEQALATHEDRLRAALAAAEGSSSSVGEVEELRKALLQQVKRAEDLEARLEEARQASEQAASQSAGKKRLSEPRISAVAISPPELAAETGVVPSQRKSPSPKLGQPAESEARPEEPPAPDHPDASDLDQVRDSHDPGDAGCQAGMEAAGEAEQEAQRMRLFRCPFAQAIDLTAAKRTRLSVPSVGSLEEDDTKHFGRRQLRSFITEVYSAKRLEDRRRDRTNQMRRPLHAIMQEILRRQHGVKRLVHQRSWQLLEAVAQHAFKDVSVGLFADFLDGTRDIHELSFYLYCSSLLATSVPEESQATPPAKLPTGFVSRVRASRLIELLFSDMPKALSVVQEELDRLLPAFATSAQSFNPSFEEFSQSGSFYGSSHCGIEADSLCRALLEGWRVCSLLLNKSGPQFLWQSAVLAFVQADIHSRGWLDPHEVQQGELNLPLGNKGRRLGELPLGDQTSLGAFVFRMVQSLGSDMASLQDVGSTVMMPSPGRGAPKLEAKANRCLQVCSTAFGSLERSLGVYLSWLLHSEEPRDRVVYQSVKARIFGYRRADSLQETWPMIHNLRCLLVLLLTHQFDMQLAREEASPEHLAWELTALLQILRESWRSGASPEAECGPDFGPELEEVGETSRDQKGPVTFSDDA